MQEIRPQKSWFRTETARPLKFIVDQDINSGTLAEHVSNTIIIVPCEEGQERDFIRHDPLLNAIFPENDKYETGGNVLSAAAAKGLEFEKVVLYKFGDAAASSIDELMQAAQSNIEKPDSMLEHEYYFNKLYVAVSRAMSNLFIIDTDEGDQKLWRSLLKHRDTLLSVNDRKLWESLVSDQIQRGTVDHFVELREEDPLRIATEFERKGIDGHNPDLLRRASDFYNRLGKSENGQLCMAHALNFEGDYNRAGKIFEGLGDLNTAGKVYWRGKCWEDYVRVQAAHGKTDSTELSIANFMVSKSSAAIANFHTFLDINQEIADSTSSQWREAIELFGRNVSQQTPESITREKWSSVGQLLANLHKKGFEGLAEYVAKCSYYGENYHRAVDFWDRYPIIKQGVGDFYLLAKARSVGFPQGLVWLQRLKSNKDEVMIAEWDSEEVGADEEQNWAEFMAPVLERANRLQDSFGLYLRIPGTDLKKLFTLCFNCASDSTSLKLRTNLEELAQYAGREKLFAEFISGLIGREKFKFELLPSDLGRVLSAILCYFARSNEDYSGQQKRATREIIRQAIHYVKKSGDWTRWISIAEMGAVYERQGRHVEALAFYEEYMKHPDPKILRHIRKRWLATKHRHLKMESEKPRPVLGSDGSLVPRPSKVSPQDVERNINRARAEIEHSMIQWGIEDKISDAFPSETALDSFTSQLQSDRVAKMAKMYDSLSEEEKRAFRRQLGSKN